MLAGTNCLSTLYVITLFFPIGSSKIGYASFLGSPTFSDYEINLCI